MITIHMQRQFVTIYPVWPYALQSCQYIYICIHTCIHTHTFICPDIIPWSLITIPWLGFLSLCLVALLKARLQRLFLCTLALKCASWTPVNQGQVAVVRVHQRAWNASSQYPLQIVWGPDYLTYIKTWTLPWHSKYGANAFYSTYIYRILKKLGSCPRTQTCLGIRAVMYACI